MTIDLDPNVYILKVGVNTKRLLESLSEERNISEKAQSSRASGFTCTDEEFNLAMNGDWGFAARADA